MSYTTDVPTGVTDAGQDMSYAFWPAQTTITLGNVSWNSDYRDVVKFDSYSQLREYVARNGSRSLVIPHVSYAKFGQPINLPIPFNEANSFNYIIVENGAIHADAKKTFAYFITHVEHVAPGTTRIYVQLDVWQTFEKKVQFGRAYVERGHVGMANSKAEEQNGRDYLTVPEGLDLGGDYVVAGAFTNRVSPSATEHSSYIVVSSVDLKMSGGDVDDPIVKGATGQESNHVTNGADVYYFETGVKFRNFLSATTDKPWITQGIMAAYLIPYIAPASVTGTDIPELFAKKLDSYPSFRDFKGLTNWRGNLSSSFPLRYQKLKKFLTYPYSIIEGTLHNATPLLMKPELLADYTKRPDLEMRLAQMITPPTPRIMIFPRDYNAMLLDNSAPSGLVNGEWLDFATGITNLPQVSVVNNMYANYLATNKNAIAFQHQSADWSQSRIMAGANTAFTQATGGMNLNTNMNRLSVDAVNASTTLANQTAGYNALASGVGGAVTQGTAGAARGGAWGAAAGVGMAAAGSAAQYGIQTNQNTQSASIQNQLSTGRTQATNNQAGMVRDTNFAFAEFAAEGDYQNAIAGINAKVQDAAMIQPTTSGQSGGDSFNFSIQKGYQFVTKLKRVDNNAVAMIGEFWFRYGYAVNRFFNMNNRVQVMSNFTYWKVKELYLTSSECPELFRQALRGIFEKGVTVWNDANDIATLDVADNTPKAGITL